MQLLLNAQVYAPQPLGRRHLLVAGERIVWLGDRQPALDRSLDVEVHDLAGARLIPGLIDGHAHITGGGGESGFRSRVPPVALSDITGAGVTTVVGVLGTDDTTRNTAGLLAQTRALVEEGITAYCHCGGYHLPPVTLTGSVRGDIVHVDRIIGVGELAISDHRSSQPTLEELLRIASDVHVASLTTGKAGIVHLHLGDGPRGLALVREALERSELPPRVFNPTHCNRQRRLLEEAGQLARAGSTIDLTAFPPDDDDEAVSADEALLGWLDAGLPPGRITVSSDGGGCLPRFDAEGQLVDMDVGSAAELAAALGRLIARGVALERVLPAFTSNVAKLLRLPAKGCIAVGADADLVVLDESGRVRDVMARGRWHLRDGRHQVVGFFER